MNENLKKQLDSLAVLIEARTQIERIFVLALLMAGLVLTFLSLTWDPMRAEIVSAGNQVNTVTRQIQAQQSAYANMVEQSQEDPSKFANDRLEVIARQQAQLQLEIESLAGNLVTPNDMTRILTSVLERQSGLELISFRNTAAKPLRSGISETSEENDEQLANVNVSGQVYEHGLVIEFEGDFFSTLKYLRFLEEITGSFFWDSVGFSQQEWPNAIITLQIHTLSTDRGFIGV